MNKEQEDAVERLIDSDLAKAMHKLNHRFTHLRKIIIAAIVIISLGCAFGIQQSYMTTLNLREEGKQRRSDSCVIQEREHNNRVRQLTQTYKYLQALGPKQIQDPLNQFVIRNLPQTEQQAKERTAPLYCDEPGVGLKEPAPKVPKRPADVNTLFNEVSKQ